MLETVTPRALAGLDVDHVGAGRRHRHQPQPRRPLERRLAHRRLVGDDDVGIGNPPRHLLGRGAVEHLQLVREAQGRSTVSGEIVSRSRNTTRAGRSDAWLMACCLPEGRAAPGSGSGLVASTIRPEGGKVAGPAGNRDVSAALAHVLGLALAPGAAMRSSSSSLINFDHRLDAPFSLLLGVSPRLAESAGPGGFLLCTGFGGHASLPLVHAR